MLRLPLNILHTLKILTGHLDHSTHSLRRVRNHFSHTMLPPILMQSRLGSHHSPRHQHARIHSRSVKGRVFHVDEDSSCFFHALDTSTSRKRAADEVDEPSTQLKASKAPKRTSLSCSPDTLGAEPFIVFSLFLKPDAAHSAFSWAPALGPAKTCLHGINLAPEPRSKVAAFDLDGCLIVSSHGAGKKLKAKSSDTLFEWWRPVVPKRLKQVYDDGCVSREISALLSVN